jgi:hypothetical protein
MKRLNQNQMENVNGGRFLGTGWVAYSNGPVEPHPSCPSGLGYYQQQSYTVLWVVTVDTRSELVCLAPTN